jgi:hypothetical protein
LVFADSLAGFIESKADLDYEAPFFKEKPWLWSNLLNFTVKHEIDVFNIIEKKHYNR